MPLYKISELGMDSSVRAMITSKGIELGNNITLAESLLARMKGLLGKAKLEAGGGLLIRPCKGIHTFFMQFPIDAVFLSKDNQVVSLVHAIPPNRMSHINMQAVSVLELPAGTLGERVVVGDTIDFI